MLALLKKDFITSRKSVIIMNLIAACILGGVSLFKEFPIEAISMMYIMASIFIPLMSNKMMSTEEGKRNYDTIINSFPVSRKSVVISKNLFYFLMYLITSIILLLTIIIIKKPSTQDLTYILFIQSLTFIYYSLIIGIPNYMYYKFDYDVAMKYGVIVFLSIIYVPMIVLKIGEKVLPNFESKIISIIEAGNLQTMFIAVSAFLVGLLIYVVFTILSINGYSKKDLS